MVNLEYLKQYHSIKDVVDIIDEIEKLDYLNFQNDWNAVSQHIQEVSSKHPVEAGVYNAVRIPAQTIQDAAAACRQFLLALGAEKITKELSKHSGGN